MNSRVVDLRFGIKFIKDWVKTITVLAERMRDENKTIFATNLGVYNRVDAYLKGGEDFRPIRGVNDSSAEYAEIIKLIRDKRSHQKLLHFVNETFKSLVLFDKLLFLPSHLHIR